MFRKLKKYIRGIRKILKNNKRSYIFYSSLPINDTLVLLEGGQGSNINGNMFAMLKELCTNPRWKDYQPVVVVKENTATIAQNRIRFYGFTHVTICVRNSDAYCRYLATAKYLLTDNTFPPYFSKRKGQIYLNTWHGTPLKTLGKSNKANLSSIGNVQKNYLSADYALFPNEFTRNVFMHDYDLELLFKNYSFIGCYPRNYIFYDGDAGIQIKEQLGLKEKTVFAYMPTWRSAKNAQQKKLQLEKTKAILDEFDKELDDSIVLLVNLHFLLASHISCDTYRHIRYFDSNYETYEILNVCDGLITDYSSVLFDFAITKKKIILYAYDRADYLEKRGLYLPFDSLPFPIVDSVKDAVALCTKDVLPYDGFIKEYCPNGSQNCCEKIFELMVAGSSDCYTLERSPLYNDTFDLIYIGNIEKLSDKKLDAIRYYMSKDPNKHYLIAYRKALKQTYLKKLETLSGNFCLYGILSVYNFKYRELFLFLQALISNNYKSDSVQDIFARNNTRFFPSMKPQHVVNFAENNSFMIGSLSTFACQKQSILYNGMPSVRNYFKKVQRQTGFEFIDTGSRSFEHVWQLTDPADRESLLAARSGMKHTLSFYFNVGHSMRCASFFVLTTPVPIDTQDAVIAVGNAEYKPKINVFKQTSTKTIGFYSFSIPVIDVVDLPATNPVYLRYSYHNIPVDCPTTFLSPFKHSRFMGLRGPMQIYKPTNTVAIFRQSRSNKLVVYVRSVNVSDTLAQRFKQLVAFLLAPLWRTDKAKHLVLLYEKNSSQYEESASVLYEKLFDLEYKNAFFILDKDYRYFDSVPKKYLSRIIHKYSFRHYLYFFKAKTFIGTEALVHAIDLKTFNVLPLYKISRKNLNYVFLQHGVMYMVSLDSESRNMFKPKNLSGVYRVVVSSKAEARHFVTLGRHLSQDLYITGLPKYDRNLLYTDADKIIIMLTWRPWEINEARTDFTKTAYYKMLLRIYHAVPKHLKDSVIILPHPLIANELSGCISDISDKVHVRARYDEVLRQARVLITDYSSIAYDAFYRGTRVIFYWEEKDYCMKQYGPTTKLLLNEDNVYGDYFYNEEGLTEAIERNYTGQQSETYRARYSKLVEFHDGNNTERLIECLRSDEII